MEKVLNLYNRIYKPVYKGIKQYMKEVRSSLTYYEDVVFAMSEFDRLGDRLDKTQFRLPFIVARQLSKEGDFQRSREYINHLLEEKKRVEGMPIAWRDSSLGRYAIKVIKNRISKAKKKAGRQLKRHLVVIRNDLFDLFEQEGFIRFEMINGKKEIIKKKVAGKDLPGKQVDEAAERDYYVQNGYQYWPYDGESWLDELGNYHYVGIQSCE